MRSICLSSEVPSAWSKRLHRVDSALFSSIIASEIASSKDRLVFISFSCGVNLLSKCVCKILTYWEVRDLEPSANRKRDFCISSVGEK